MMTEQQHAAWNQARLLKQAIKRNADKVASLLPVETQKRLIELEMAREASARKIREYEFESYEVLTHGVELATA